MYQQETIKPYNSGDKAQQVEQMFDNIAPTYDTLNHRLSWDIDKGWRRKAIRQLLPYRPQSLLDIATGMMDIGRQKVAKLRLDSQISFERQDCMSLTYEDNTFDAVTAAFGIRNFADLDRGLAEICRVLRKGGNLSIVELTSPVAFPMKQLFRIYSHTVLPLYGRLISKDQSAYSYLTKTIEAFPQGERMTDILKKAGFSQARFKRLTFGICTMYFATK